MFYFITLIIGVVLGIYIARELERKACLPIHFNRGIDFNVQPEASEIRVVLLGDTGSGNSQQKQVAAAMEKTCAEKGCDLVLLLGDNFIMDGVSDVGDPQFQYKFEDIYSLSLPFYAVLGNHDFRGSWRAQIEYTQRSERWKMPDVNYAIEAGPVLFQAINTTCTICSLASLFGKKQKPWKVVFGHRPFVTSGRHRGMTGLERFLILLSKTQFVFSGHNHILEHLHYKGIDQIVSGGGGNPIHEIAEKPSPFKKFLLQDLGYVWVHFTAQQVNTHFFDATGQEVYHFTRSR